ncbi:5002_t:CDS:2 [Ambispora gerdemannii]|uniref:5002_t:CDS:1 n=1 Tax=Ambispora gerdemannii TaxID=144530 RepID=A0A9N9FRN2_9GLOM|nr:5002_t:CDS:2 [Ambispora gerdemannii]
MAQNKFLAINLFNKLQNPVPQYVLCCLPAIATIGASPKADASVIERLSSLASAYYIVLGAAVAIARLAVTSICQDWPYIPLALAWTLPAIYRRTVHGKLLVRDPKLVIRKGEIIVKKLLDDEYKKHIHNRVLLTALASIAVPWISVIIAYFTPPRGFFCRSKYLSVFCAIWSFNSALAYIHHRVEKKFKFVDNIIHIWFTVCGVGVGIFIIALAVISTDRTWWISLLGEACNKTCHVY